MHWFPDVEINTFCYPACSLPLQILPSFYAIFYFIPPSFFILALYTLIFFSSSHTTTHDRNSTCIIYTPD